MTRDDDSTSRETSPAPSQMPTPTRKPSKEESTKKLVNQDPPPSDHHQQSDVDDLPDYQSDVEETNAQDPAPSSSSPPPPTERERQEQVALSEADVFLDLVSDLLLNAPAQPAAEEESDDSAPNPDGDEDEDNDEAALDNGSSGSRQE